MTPLRRRRKSWERGLPKRASHSAGSYWYYNNWDFNALGSIFEKEFKVPIGGAFDARIARRIGMQDFRVEDMYYLRAAADASPDFNKSIHPAYRFRMTARDLARFGYLFLRNGEWRGEPVVPSAWVSESTQAHSQADTGRGYGYLWWISREQMGQLLSDPNDRKPDSRRRIRYLRRLIQ